MLSKTSQVEEYLRNEMIQGKLPVGKKIPSRSQLCRRFQCSRTIVERAVDLLIRDGLLIGRKGSGTYVRNERPTGDRIRSLKILSDFWGTPKDNPDLPSLNLDDLQISVE